MKNNLFFLLITGSWFILFGCEQEPSDEHHFINDSAATEWLFEESCDTIRIDSTNYILEAYLYRDFMPVSPPEGRPLVSLNCLVALDSAEIPLTINLVKQFVIYHDTIWIKHYEKDDYDDKTRSYQLCRVSINGPLWEPGVLVDIVAEIYNSKNDSTYYLRSLDQLIEKTF